FVVVFVLIARTGSRAANAGLDLYRIAGKKRAGTVFRRFLVEGGNFSVQERVELLQMALQFFAGFGRSFDLEFFRSFTESAHHAAHQALQFVVIALEIMDII